MRAEGLEPPCREAPDPKSGMSTNSTTPALLTKSTNSFHVVSPRLEWRGLPAIASKASRLDYLYFSGAFQIIILAMYTKKMTLTESLHVVSPRLELGPQASEACILSIILRDQIRKIKLANVFLISVFCAPGGIRTPNPLVRSQIFYPLNYGCNKNEGKNRKLPPYRIKHNIRSDFPFGYLLYISSNR